MKKEEHHHPYKLFFSISGKKFTRRAAYLLLLVALSYALGFFSSSVVKRPEGIQKLRLSEPATGDYPDLLRFRTQCAPPVPPKLIRQTVLDRLYNGTSPFAGFPPAHAGPLLRPKRMKGWGSTGAVFENLMRRVKPRTIVEVGSFLGASATHMASLARSLQLRTQILCIDDFRGWPGFRSRIRDIAMVNGDGLLLYQFMQNVAYMNVTEMVVPIPFSTSSALAKLCEWGVYADLVEVDAGHDFHSAWSDINMAYALLRPGGVIFGHDYFTAADDRGVRRAVNLFARVKGLAVQVDGQHWVIDSTAGESFELTRGRGDSVKNFRF